MRSVTIPALVAAGINAYYLWNEHWEHWSHKPPLEERVEYPYQNVRVKNFPWGDGDKTLLYVVFLLSHFGYLLVLASPGLSLSCPFPTISS